MMKKLMAAALTACMLLSPVSAAAEDTGNEEVSASSVTWEEISSSEEGADVIREGDFYSFNEIAVSMWIPDSLKETELTKDDRDNGYIGYFQSEDGVRAAAVMYVNVGGEGLSSYKKELAEMDDVSAIRDMRINGIECISYDMKDADTSSIAFATKAGFIMEFSFAPMSDEDFSYLATIMAASIQPSSTAPASARSTEEASEEDGGEEEDSGEEEV